MLHKFSNIPIDHLRVYVEDCLNIADYITSVGCGHGVYEYEISKNQPKLRSKLILVDPNPESFDVRNGQDYLKPDYDHVEDLVKDKPAVVGNCVLLLIWPPPVGHYKYSNYEISAISALNPRSVICLYEVPKTMPNGSSGSEELITFMRGSEREGSDSAFRLISTTRYAYNRNYPKITWIARKNTQVPKVKKCLLLQKEADKICGDELNGEDNYTFDKSDLLKLMSEMLSAGTKSAGEIGRIIKGVMENIK